MNLLGRLPTLCKLSVNKVFTNSKSYLRKMSYVSKINSPYFQKILTPELNSLICVFNKHGFELRVVGGAVRDLLMGIQPHDIDFASTATPREMIKMFEEEGIRILNMNGEKHGTITARIDDKENFEITTLRLDSHAQSPGGEVIFTKNWAIDAERRDLTINSMFLDFDGNLYDYFAGKEDLKNRKIQFVKDANLRIQDDYLRILRYFRFYGQVALLPNNHLPQTLKAIKNNLEGLNDISGERIWIELKKILSGNHVLELVHTMIELGMGPYIGLPENPNLEEFKRISPHAIAHKARPITLLTALVQQPKDIFTLVNRLKPSNLEKDICCFIMTERINPSPAINAYKKLVLQEKDKTHLKEHVTELLKYTGQEEMLQKWENWDPPQFPLSGHHIMQKGFKPGPMFQPLINKLKEIWVDSNYNKSKEELMEMIPALLEDTSKLAPLRSKRNKFKK